MREADVDRSLVKIIFLGSISAVAAGAFGYFLSILKPGDFPENLVALGAAAALWCALLVVNVFAVKSPTIAWGIAAGSTLVFLVPLYAKISFYLLLGALLLVCFLGGGWMLGRRELHNRVKIRFATVGLRSLGAFLTGLALCLTGYVMGNLATSDYKVPEAMTENAIRAVAPIVTRSIPDFGPDATVDEVLASFIRNKVSAEASPEEVKAGIDELKKRISASTGMTLVGNETMKGVVDKNLFGKFREAKTQTRVLALVIAALVILLVIKGFAFFLKWIIILVAFFLYRLLLTLNFFYIGLEPREQEIIIMK